jgi:hypothetical protein
MKAQVNALLGIRLAPDLSNLAMNVAMERIENGREFAAARSARGVLATCRV